MKKTITVLFICAMLFGLCSCGNAGGDSGGGGGVPANSDGAISSDSTNVAEADESDIYLDSEPSLDEDAETQIKDYRPGMENKMSQYYAGGGVYSYGMGVSGGSRTIFVRQDQMLYFMNNNRNVIYKMPMDDSATGASLVYQPAYSCKEFQVVGDWFYLRYYNGNNIDGISRIQLNGEYEERLADDMSAYGGTTFVVRNNKLYYAFQNYTQISAKEKKYTNGVKCVDLDSGETRILFEMEPIESSSTSFGIDINAYTEETMLIDLGEQLLIYDFDADTFIDAPAEMREQWPSLTMGNAYLAVRYRRGSIGETTSTETIYRYAPENGFEPEVWYSETLTKKGDTSPWRNIFVAEDMVFVVDVMQETQFSVIKNGERSIINSDTANGLFWIDDGYIYYSYISGLYRVRPDGTDWEQLDWYELY